MTFSTKTEKTYPLKSLPPEPDQPGESTWKFVEDLQSPLWKKIPLRPRVRRPYEACLTEGVTLDLSFDDPCQVLVTAYEDLRSFLSAMAIDASGPYRISIGRDSNLGSEAYRISVAPESCEITASGTEGVRRAIFFLEDEILRSSGPFLPLGVIERTPVIRTRISRCFFGPIHRPPKNRDELTDEINYYPDEYLNRLAHEGINGLWLTIHFDEICRSSILPEMGQHSERRLNKLRRTVAQCARYGIKIYLFTTEPNPLWPESPVGLAHPELLGHLHPDRQRRHFCTGTAKGQKYLEEALYNLFTDVPGLGGLINITVGEGGSHCYSYHTVGNTCPQCSLRDPHDVLYETIAAMERGMHAANPEAELISWPYGQYNAWGDRSTVASAGRLPQGVILQHNFESSAEVEQCGRIHKIQDYWLSFIGPSQLFIDCARAATQRGNRMGAKLQVGCSHEVATVPFVPVPGHLYQKYQTMHDLGVSCVMQCWYFGNYPGLMTRAAGELSFAPLPDTEDEFLTLLAKRDWGEDAGEVVRAWKAFQASYQSFPLNHVFGWFGPVHDAPVWPLYLEPVDIGIAPSWLIGPASGDRFGECFAYTHTVPEILFLTRKMAQEWERGAAILRCLLPNYAENEERRKEIGVALALGIQFESTANMIEFYTLREELPYVSSEKTPQILAQMRSIVLREEAQDEELLALCAADSRLGFHSEAEGYKYFPAKIHWRMKQLKDLLDEGFPRLEAQLKTGDPLWPHYTGRQPEGKIYRCARTSIAPELDGNPTGPFWNSLESQVLSFGEVWPLGKSRAEVSPSEFGLEASWKACHHADALYLGIVCYSEEGSLDSEKRDDFIRLLVEPRRLWPNHWYDITPDGSIQSEKYPTLDRDLCTAVTLCHSKGWSSTIRIPFKSLSDHNLFERPVRMDVERNVKQGTAVLKQSWVKRNPLPHRLVFGTANPADMGWIIMCD